MNNNYDYKEEYCIFGSFVTNENFRTTPNIPIECIAAFIDRIAKPLNKDLKFMAIMIPENKTDKMAFLS